MARTKRQLKREEKATGRMSHSAGCGYPSEPCNCEVNNVSERRTSHKSYCNYPNDPCCCGLYGGY